MTQENSENRSRISTLPRFHFVCGLPRSGAGLLLALLAQNPRFVTGSGGPARQIFTDMVDRFADGGELAELLDDAQKTAVWRSIINAIYHNRPAGSVVFDFDPDWLPYADLLVRLYPLSRFIICVRNPAVIVNGMELAAGKSEESQDGTDIAALIDENGPVGSQIAALREALSSQHAERMLVVDYDRLADDPEDVMDVLYDFLREPEYAHNFEEIGAETAGFSGPVERSDAPTILTTRTILQLSGKAFWRNLRRTSATMMLGRAR